MKYRIMGIMAMLCMLLTVLLVTTSGNDSVTNRIHQHKTARGPDAGCDCDGTKLCTHLPLVLIDTGGQEIPGKVTGETDAFGEMLSTVAADGRDVINVAFSVVDHQDRNNHPTDAPTLSAKAEIRIRGHSSRLFEKSSYQLDFVDENGEAVPAPVMGMAAHSEWVLYGPYLDKSLVRNYMWYNISGEIMEWAPNVRYCELILNGEYRGLYLMSETITDGEDCRLDLSTTAKNLKATGYLLRGDRTSEEDLDGVRDIYSYLERMLSMRTDILIKYPRRSALTEELRKEIELDFSEFEKALYSYDYDTDDFGYGNFIDVDNFVDYFIINEFCFNSDAGRFSTYLYKDLSGKYKLAVWDFNNACDNYVENEMTPDRITMHSRYWFFMLCKSEDFVERILKRYDQLRQTVLNETYLLHYVDETLAYLGPAVERNSQRWKEAITQWAPLSPVSRNTYSTQQAAEQLKEWLYARGIWLDENFHTIWQYCHPSSNKVYNH